MGCGLLLSPLKKKKKNEPTAFRMGVVQSLLKQHKGPGLRWNWKPSLQQETMGLLFHHDADAPGRSRKAQAVPKTTRMEGDGDRGRRWEKLLPEEESHTCLPNFETFRWPQCDKPHLNAQSEAALRGSQRRIRSLRVPPFTEQHRKQTEWPYLSCGPSQYLFFQAFVFTNEETETPGDLTPPPGSLS